MYIKKQFIKFSLHDFLILTSISIISLLFAGCISIKPAATKSGKKYFETFFAGEEGSQYFIKPISFQSKASNHKITADLTFRYKNQIKDSATVNFSIIGRTLYKSLDSIIISNSTVKCIQHNCKLLFNENRSNTFVSRFSVKCSLKDLTKLYNDEQWEIIIFAPTEKVIFTPTSKSIKAINQVNKSVFSIL